MHRHSAVLYTLYTQLSSLCCQGPRSRGETFFLRWEDQAIKDRRSVRHEEKEARSVSLYVGSKRKPSRCYEWSGMNVAVMVFLRLACLRGRCKRKAGLHAHESESESKMRLQSNSRCDSRLRNSFILRSFSDRAYSVIRPRTPGRKYHQPSIGARSRPRQRIPASCEHVWYKRKCSMFDLIFAIAFPRCGF